ncbi:PHP domain-containing protein [Cuspidothrix issatschenkoi]|uniref:PHP domain-containing protein n=1 Tax=Cuspidothrix issatschenkoi CHARLIE-1 TaxID=2052836 RepID=A0A2S6CV70_9CYAN|nr:PHP domain-containing protein [Cuspidothrix issatschenkoi]PPJ63587.1 PHP domain-containing protein [Cuspidothrix issatschenkoi CHARLIE-1]
MVVNFARTTVSKELLKQVFQRIDAQSCPKLFNFHMHTVHSDGKLEPGELMTQAIAIGLKGLAITDHHSVSGYQIAEAWLKDWQWNNPGIDTPHLWSGVEINANLLNTEVHILAYAFELEHPSMKPYLQKMPTVGKAYQANNVITAIHEAGGLAILAHPARYRRSHFDLIPVAADYGIDGVEAFYAYSNPKPWKPSVIETEEVQQLAEKFNLLNTCGTDTHGVNLLQRL